jgi:hypothetical protein
MPATAGRRRVIRLAIAVVAVLLVVGCADQPTTSTAASTPGTSPTTTPEPTTTTIPPMTAEEVAWLDGLRKLHNKLDKVVQDSPTNLTGGVMAALAKGLRGCSRALAQLGTPTDRLQPVYKLAEKGCAQYEKGAKCFAIAASIIVHPIASSAEERKLNQSIDCGFSAPATGSGHLTAAEVKGLEIKETVG